MALLPSEALGGVPILVFQTRIGSVAEKQSDDLLLAFRGGRHQRREAFQRALDVYLGTLLQQEFDGLGLSATRGVQQRGSAAFVLCVELRALFQ